ncbi:MAG: AmmeMemoRadiSam system protein A [Candidatus Neomarinimicrobiota bacterium]
MTNDQKIELLTYVRQYYEHTLLGQAMPSLPPDPFYEKESGLFVTLHRQGELRGCIGYIVGYKSLKNALRDMAHAAAFDDHRFLPLEASELELIDIEISILSELADVHDYHDILIGVDGILLKNASKSAVFLPQVASEQGWDLKTTLKHLCLKAGLSVKAYKDPSTSFQVFTAEVFSEKEFTLV